MRRKIASITKIFKNAVKYKCEELEFSKEHQSIVFAFVELLLKI